MSDTTEPRYTADRRAMARCDAGVRVLHLEGTDEEMARQHAELLQAEIRTGALPFMAGFLSRNVAGGETLAARLGAGLLGRGVDLLCTLVAHNLPLAQRRPFHLVAAAAGLSPREADRAVGLPDALVILMHLAARVRGLEGKVPSLGGLRPGRSAGFACSGAMALPSVTADRHLLHARNLDYDGLGTYDRYPTVAFCRPARGLPYAWIASAGVQTAALDGLNAAGLFLGSNTAPTTDLSLRGEPFFGLNEQVVREARTLGEAVDLLGRRRPASGYNVHLSHGPSADAVMVEYSFSRRRVRTPRAGLLWTTNHYLDPEMAATTPPNGLVDNSNTWGRYDRLRALLHGARGRIDVPFLVGCLRDQIEHRTGARHPFGDVICNYLTIASVVCDVTAARLWVAADPAPASLGRFVDLDFHRELDAFRRGRQYPLRPLKADPTVRPLAQAAIQDIQQAHLALCRPGQEEIAYRHVQAAAAKCPDEPRLLLQQAFLALKLGRLDTAATHAEAFLAAAPNGEPRRYRAHLVLAWCAELRGAAADHHHAAAAAAGGGAVQAEAELAPCRRHRFTERDRRALHVDLYNARRFPI
ncbi:MAG: hypothetical protein HY906_21725 [Deltaproteobacteria bacterium]|nr:hypothetical protein [Deltaproteobacteria bacterium]